MYTPYDYYGIFEYYQEHCGKKLPPKLKLHFFSHFLSAIIYFQNVSMVTIVITKLTTCKSQNHYLLCFRKVYTLYGLLLFFHELQVNEGEVVEKIKIFKKVTHRERAKLGDCLQLLMSLQFLKIPFIASDFWRFSMVFLIVGKMLLWLGLNVETTGIPHDFCLQANRNKKIIP